MPNIAGSWEFLLASNTQPGYTTGLEAALQEGQTFDLNTGMYVYTGQISAAGSQISFVGFTPTGNIVFGGNCAPAVDDTGNSLAGSITGLGGPMNFTFTENGNVFNVTAELDPSGQFIDSGTYTAQSGNDCNDSGIVASGEIVPKLSGMYSGQLLLNDTNYSATATLSESSGTLSVNLGLTSPDVSALTLTGPVTGNAFFVQGDFQGTTVAYYGYYELIVQTINGASVNVPSLYFANAATPSQSAGLLSVPQTP